MTPKAESWSLQSLENPTLHKGCDLNRQQSVEVYATEVTESKEEIEDSREFVSRQTLPLYNSRNPDHMTQFPNE